MDVDHARPGRGHGVLRLRGRSQGRAPEHERREREAPDFSVSAYKTEGMSFGAQYGLATTQTVTIAIPNSAFEAVADWLGMGSEPKTGGGS